MTDPKFGKPTSFGFDAGLLGSPEIAFAQAKDAYQASNFAVCEQKCRMILRRFPAYLPAMALLGLTLGSTGRLLEAISLLEVVVERDPSSYGSLNGLSILLRDQGKPEEAVAVRMKACALRPENAHDLHELGLCLVAAGRLGEAVPLLREAARMEPDNVEYQYQLGNQLQQNGQYEESIAPLERAIQLAPAHGMAYRSLVGARKLGADDDALIERMQSIVDLPGISDSDRELIAFSLGKARDDRGEFKQAMESYEIANELAERRRFASYGPVSRRKFAKSSGWCQSVFTEEFIDSHRSLASQSDPSTSQAPIFVFGMVRSGTTLVEQILSGHSAIFGAGELPFWTDEGRKMMDDPRLSPHEALRSATDRYLEKIGGLLGDATRVIDKMPNNFLMLGAIHAALPQAKLIHCRRSPVDNCLSIYFQYWPQPLPAGHRPEDIVFAYRQYQLQMEHWRRVIPETSMIEIEYEDIVKHREPTLRRIFAFLELEWDDAVLNHESNPRPIKTHSWWQARQSVYSTSVDRWKNYEPWLGAFRDLLDD